MSTSCRGQMLSNSAPAGGGPLLSTGGCVAAAAAAAATAAAAAGVSFFLTRMRPPASSTQRANMTADLRSAILPASWARLSTSTCEVSGLGLGLGLGQVMEQGARIKEAGVVDRLGPVPPAQA